MNKRSCVEVNGLYLNSKGKEQSAKETVNTIINIFKEKKVDSVTMKWKEEHAMVRAKNHIPLANKNHSYEKKKNLYKKGEKWPRLICCGMALKRMGMLGG
jgi:hypothetical protein